jgi:hypothetical protein
MYGGHATFMETGLAVKNALFARGVTTVPGMTDAVKGLWVEIRRKLRLPLGTVCPVIVDEAQVLAKTEYPHVVDQTVRAP